MDAILPATKPGETIDIFIGIDTSGSIGPEELKIFFSEIKGIMDSYTEYIRTSRTQELAHGCYFACYQARRNN